MPILLAIALLGLSACHKQPAPQPKPKPHSTAIPFDRLPNYQKAIIMMKRMKHSPASIKAARRAMPDILAKAEARTLRHPASPGACTAWDRVAINAMQQNDPTLVHLWGTLADRRCAGSGQQPRYWDGK